MKVISKKAVIGIIILCIIFAFVIAILMISEEIVISWDDDDNIKMESIKIEEGWIIKIVSSHAAYKEKESGIPISRIPYKLGNLNGWVGDINGSYSQNNTIIFFDNDNNGLLNKNDTFFIVKNTRDNIDSGDVFSLYARPGFGGYFHEKLT